jgi:D-serine dehydratase
MGELVGGKLVETWRAACPVLDDITPLLSALWFNRNIQSFNLISLNGGFLPDDVTDAVARLVKLDKHLPISGSVKVRGGIYQALKLAETIAIENGLLDNNTSFKSFGSTRHKTLFSQNSIAVGSTGNLAPSIVMIGIKLGFNVTVHVLSYARQWKKIVCGL